LAETCSYFLLLNTIINPYYHSCGFMTDIYLTISDVTMLNLICSRLWQTMSHDVTTLKPDEHQQMCIEYTPLHPQLKKFKSQAYPSKVVFGCIL